MAEKLKEKKEESRVPQFPLRLTLKDLKTSLPLNISTTSY
jgi:hypothetical protein